MRRTMVLIDFWTLFHVIFVAVQIFLLVLLAKKLKAVVTYEANTGRGSVTEKVLVGDPVEEPKTPIRKGYLFDGWYSDHEYTNKWEFYKAIDQDTTLYAKWNPEPGQALQQADLQAAPAAPVAPA